MISAIIAIAFSSMVDADRVFARARDVWATQSVPSYLEYRVTTTVARGGRDTTNHYAAACYCEKNELLIDKISDEQIAHPPVPHGINFSIGFTVGMGNGGRETVGKMLTPTQIPDPVGVPVLSPLYAFGMQLPPEEPNDDVSPTKLPVIATTTTAVRHYTIVLAGDDDIDGHSAYHLVLQPLSRPQTYRLRDVWVDRTTYATLKARVACNFDGAWFSAQPWSIYFANDLGYQHIAYEESDGAASLNGRKYDDAKISFDDFNAPQSPSKKFWLQTPVYEPLSEP